jgi:methylmalonyl-CoA mutase
MSDFPRVTEADWRKRVAVELGGPSPATLTKEMLDGLTMAPLYVAGEMPPTHRVNSRHAAGIGWQRCQAVDDHDLDAAIERVRADRDGGVDALWLRCDRAVRLGHELDGDLPLAGLGHDGLLVADAADISALLRAAGPGPLGVVLDAGGNALPATAALVAAVDESGVDPTDLRIRLGIDPLGALLTDGQLPDAAAALTAEAAELIETVGAKFQRCRVMAVSLNPYARAGASPVQQLAAMLATVVQYLRWLEQAGVEPAVGIRQIDLIVPTDRDFLVGVAKLRAVRVLWSKLVAGLQVHPCAPWLHAVTDRRVLTRRDAWVNILRVTGQTAAAIIGGADEITSAPFDAKLGAPDDLGRRLARNTQSILDEECGLGDTVDPAAGSHALETLTETLARGAWEMFREIERGGGMQAVISGGHVQDAVERRTHERSNRLADGRDAIVGATHYPPTDDASPDRPRRDPDAALRNALRRQAERAARRGDPLLEALRATVYDDESKPGARAQAAIDAAAAGATIAEIADSLRPGAAEQRARRLRPHSDEEIWQAMHHGEQK